METEAKKFGNLLGCTIPRVGAGGQGKVFLEYATPGEAGAAFGALNGREFGPNRVVATYFPEADYTGGVFK